MKTCKMCGSPVENNKAKYCCDECRQAAAKRDSSVYKCQARAKAVKEREQRLNDKIRRAAELGISYGELIAREYIEHEQQAER